MGEEPVSTAAGQSERGRPVVVAWGRRLMFDPVVVWRYASEEAYSHLMLGLYHSPRQRSRREEAACSAGPT